MIEGLSSYTNIMFLVAWLVGIVLFHFANSKPYKLISLLIIVSIIQSILAYIGFYHDTSSVPPRFILALGPSIVVIIYGLLPKQLAWLRSHRVLKYSTLLHAIRIPVELTLFQLFLHGSVPELMTYHGRNFDILAGIIGLALGVILFFRPISNKLMIIWNIIGLAMVTFILANGILSSRLPVQQFAFDQPNVAIEYFPFILLPAIIVPLVVYTHITDIIFLRSNHSSKNLKEKG